MLSVRQAHSNGKVRVVVHRTGERDRLILIIEGRYAETNVHVVIENVNFIHIFEIFFIKRFVTQLNIMLTSLLATLQA